MKKYFNYDFTVIVTKRCNSRCKMCNIWANPSQPERELNLETINKIPYCRFSQITGGEPFLRDDIKDIVKVLTERSKRLLINTNGYYTDKILEIGKEFPQTAIRISIDGKKETHNQIRGIDIYERAIMTLSELKRIGVKDIGISFTLQEDNYMDLLSVFHTALDMGVDFGCVVVHNSFYFDKEDNKLEHKNEMKEQLSLLIKSQLRTRRVKDWARAFVNDYSIHYIEGDKKLIPCDAGTSSFIIDVDGNVLPCNMTEKPLIMGNLQRQTWEEILHSDRAEKISKACRECPHKCWAMCNVQTAIRKRIWIPACWLVNHKLMLLGEKQES